MIEVEIKAHVDDLSTIEQKIIADGAVYVKTVYQKDTYFKHPKRNFAKTDEAIRIRNEGNRAILTYKGPKLDRKSKSREEIEVEIKKPDLLHEILVRLDFIPVPAVEKTRKLFNLNDMTVSLDDVKDVGSFIEIEMNAPSLEEYKPKRNQILSKLEEWGIGKKQLERFSYLELYYIKKGLKRE
ncbi:MAG: class IV adenylate cyclase [Candidatus Helarchaeota archaeon]